jgi:hypothetical protein
VLSDKRVAPTFLRGCWASISARPKDQPLSSRTARKLLKLGLYPVGICLDDFAAHIRSKYGEYGRIIRDTNIRSE